MECKDTLIFKRLIKISKILFPSLIVVCMIIFYLYRHSIDTVEIKVISKKVDWLDACSEYECVELPVFKVVSEDETFTTNETIYNELIEDYEYIVGTKGWNYFGTNRKLIHVY